MMSKRLKTVVIKRSMVLILTITICSAVLISMPSWAPVKYSPRLLESDPLLHYGIKSHLDSLLARIQDGEVKTPPNLQMMFHEPAFIATVIRNPAKNAGVDEYQVYMEFFFPYVQVSRKVKLEAVVSDDSPSKKLPFINSFWNIRKPD